MCGEKKERVSETRNARRRNPNEWEKSDINEMKDKRGGGQRHKKDF